MTLVFRIHYFLWYGALTSIFGYEGVYARHYTNATTMQFGYLKMVLPFATVLVTPFVCSMADRRRSHRAYFVTAIMIAMFAICCLAILPLTLNIGNQQEAEERPQNPLTDLVNSTSITDGKINNTYSNPRKLLIGPWIFYCLATLAYDLSIGVTSCLSDSFAVLQAEETGTSFGRIIVWGTIGWASSALMLSLINQASFLPRLMPGILMGASLLTLDVVIVSLWRRSEDFSLDRIAKVAASTLTGSSSSQHLDASDYLPMNESVKVNVGQELSIIGGQMVRRTETPMQILARGQNQTESSSRSKTKPEDQPATRSASPPPQKSQDMISVKTIDSDALSDSDVGSRTSERSDISSEFGSSKKPKAIVKVSKKAPIKQVDNITSAQQVNPEVLQRHTTSLRVQFILLCMIIKRRKTLIRYLILFILSGFFMALHWNFFFLYLEQIYAKDFELISALSMVGQSVLGELPFFILSRKFIDNLGRSHTLSASVITIGVRFLLYRYMLPNVSMYLIFIADCFQGPNYGLFYVIMTEVGLEYSFCDEDTIDGMAARGHIDRNSKNQVDSLRLSLRSTVQSVAFACYEGLGVGFGSLAGGCIVQNYGFETLWLWMGVAAISVGLVNICIELMCRENDLENKTNAISPVNGNEVSARLEFIDASRNGVLRRIASPRPLPSSVSNSVAAMSPRMMQIKQALAAANKTTARVAR